MYLLLRIFAIFFVTISATSPACSALSNLWKAITIKKPIANNEGMTVHRSWKTADEEISGILVALKSESLESQVQAIKLVERLVIDPQAVKSKKNHHLGREKLDTLTEELSEIYLANPESPNKQAALNALKKLFTNNKKIPPLSWDSAPKIYHDYRFPDDLRRLALDCRNHSKAVVGVPPELFQDSASMRNKDLIEFLGKGKKELTEKEVLNALAVEEVFKNVSNEKKLEIYTSLLNDDSLRIEYRNLAIDRASIETSGDVFALLDGIMGYKQTNNSFPLIYENSENGSTISIGAHSKTLTPREVTKIKTAIKEGHDLIL